MQNIFVMLWVNCAILSKFAVLLLSGIGQLLAITLMRLVLWWMKIILLVWQLTRIVNQN